jgi:iduronate 2-sulfatase
MNLSRPTRRDLLRLPALAPLAAGFASAQTKTPRTNVLFIAVDDLNTRIACYHDPVVKTPNIDRLAAHGVRFERAYCNYPVCNASRTSLLSGKRPETTRIWGNSTPPRTHIGDVVMLPEYFKAHGYFTARVGKIAHGLYENAVKWDVSESRAGVPLPPDRGGRGGASDEDNPEGGGGGVPLSFKMTDRRDEDEPDGATARRIVQLIEQNKSKPFFLGCGFHKPHLPWVAPKKYFDMYKLDQIKLPDTPRDDRDDIPAIALTHQASDDKLTDQERRQMILAYHAATTFMDAQLGLVLDALDRNKLWDNTVVVLFGDHGWHLYDHLQLWRKMTVFEQSAHAPLIVHTPGGKTGTASPRLVEFVDLYPTLTELCGLPQAPGMEGLSFAPLLKNPQMPWKKAAYTMVLRQKDKLGKSVVTERYRYTEWDGGKAGSEFYDHETDPNEWTNLAWPSRKPDAKTSAKLEDMRKLLHTDQLANAK